MIKTPEDRQAGAEIEVTPEMIEAGVDCFYGWPVSVNNEPSLDEMEEMLKRAFIKMTEVRPGLR